jgi:hypothetical protein
MRRLALLIAVAATVIPLLSSCGEKETPDAKLARLRARHEIIPAGAATVTSPDGTPPLVIDVQVFNKGTESLNQLTILVRVRSSDGTERVTQRATLDLTGVRPGVGERRTVVVPGVALAETDEISVELEANLPVEILHQLPEWSDVAPPGSGPVS